MGDSVIAAQLYTLRDFTKTPDDIRDTFNKVSELGYEAVQVSGMGAIEPQALKDIADASGLQIIATHISYQRICDEPEAVIAEHILWGCKHVAIGGLPQEYRNEEGFSRFATEASVAAQPLIDAGLTFSYHNHSFELQHFGNRTGMQMLVEDSNPATFSFEIDTYWIQHGGANPVTWLQKLSDRMHVVHLKDMAMDGSKQLFAEVGEGNLEWEAILAACRQAGIEWYIIEQDACQRDPFASLKMSLDNLRAMGLH
ncbi:MAG: sugar phosphate isomerase/epimerase family protein [Candidatus Latescibacterota bacterium]|jgi:sugar phosphate isomerase/epimerase